MSTAYQLVGCVSMYEEKENLGWHMALPVLSPLRL
jgi:hypothetical protein